MWPHYLSCYELNLHLFSLLLSTKFSLLHQYLLGQITVIIDRFREKRCK